jgi:VIT1/CCC1 family predicted Fe2+/Mn2+ transporter
VPFFFTRGTPALTATVALTGVALFGVGAGHQPVHRQAIFRGMRMLAIGATAAGVAFLVGKLLGVSLS